MRKENIPIHSEDMVSWSKTVSNKKKISRDKERVLEVSRASFSKMVVIWFYSGDNLSILNFAINSLCSEQVG